MQLALFGILSLGLLGQPSMKVDYYGSAEQGSLLVIVTKDGKPVSDALVALNDKNNQTIVQPEKTNSRGEVVFRNLNPGKHPVVWVFAERGKLSSKGVEIRWRLVMGRNLELLSETPPSNATRRPVYATQPSLNNAQKYHPVWESYRDACGNWWKICKRVPCTSIRCPGETTYSPCDVCDVTYWVRDGCTPCNLGEARLTVSVPEDAEVFINDRPTKSTGARRVYLSKGLGGGINYWYRVRVRIVRDGKVLEEIREVVLRAGDSKSVSVDFPGRNIPRPTDARQQRDKQRSK